MRSRIPVCLAFAIGSLAATSPALANVPFSKLLSHTPSGHRPNAPATDAVISGDGRQGRFAAYTSKATDIAGGGSVRKVFLVKRKRPFGNTGTRWREDRTVLVTKHANGDSWSPSLDGFDDGGGLHAPRCLAFVSKASTLVGHDPDGKTADVFIRSLSGNGLRRVPGTAGASEVVVDGRCRHLAFVKHGRPYVAAVGGGGHAVGGSGASHLDIATRSETVVYERQGGVWAWTAGRGNRRLASGYDPATDGYGDNVTFRHGNGVVKGRLDGPLHAHRVRGARKGGATMPELTTSASFLAYVVKAMVYINGYSNPKGDCTTTGRYALPGRARDPRMSSHGNYLVYSCVRGPAWLTYVGDQATGSPH